LPSDAVYFGEISLSGAVRPVAQAAARLKEARKLGFARAIVPEAARAEGTGEQGLSLQYVDSLAALVGEIAGGRTEDRRRGRM
jgi:DNA repair protein RadA/Sms